MGSFVYRLAKDSSLLRKDRSPAMVRDEASRASPQGAGASFGSNAASATR